MEGHQAVEMNAQGVGGSNYVEKQRTEAEDHTPAREQETHASEKEAKEEEEERTRMSKGECGYRVRCK